MKDYTVVYYGLKRLGALSRFYTCTSVFYNKKHILCTLSLSDSRLDKAYLILSIGDIMTYQEPSQTQLCY